MRVFNKLVRDKIIDIIENNEKDATIKYRILEDKEYIDELNKKLQEEITEYLEDNNVEEIADIVEVLYAILDYKEISHEEFEKIRLDKVERCGAFKERIFLERELLKGEKRYK